MGATQRRMKLMINDIFYSLQGEGVNAGMAAVFVRLAGCNRKCAFCDTDTSVYREMSLDDIIAAADTLTLESRCRFVVLTGGEPAMQIDSSVIEAFHGLGYKVAVETNGSLPLPAGIDWLTVSPKGDTVVTHCDELKCIFTGGEPVDDHGIKARFYCLQPCDVGDAERNRRITEACVEYVRRHPRWRLSLQTHKLAGFK